MRLPRQKMIEQKTVAIRTSVFPGLDVRDLWHHTKSDGFTSIPRTLPLVMNIVDDLTKGSPASKTYFALWARVFPEMYVNLQGAEELAYHSGLTGQRWKRDWEKRMRALADLGFILIANGPRENLMHAVIINPHFAVRRLYIAETPGLTKAAFDSLVERANQVGMTDMVSPLPEDAPAIPPIPPAPPTLATPTT